MLCRNLSQAPKEAALPVSYEVCTVLMWQSAPKEFKWRSLTTIKDAGHVALQLMPRSLRDERRLQGESNSLKVLVRPDVEDVVGGACMMLSVFLQNVFLWLSCNRYL